MQQSEPAGRLQELLTSFVTRVTNAVSTLTNAVTALLSLLAFLGTGLVIDPLSTGAVLVALALVGAVLTPVRRRIRARAGDSAGANIDFAGSVAELGGLGLEMQTFGVQDRFARRIDGLSHAATTTQQRVQFLTGALAPIYMTLAYAAVLAGVAILSFVGFGELSVIGAVMLLMLRSLAYGQQLAAASGTLAAAVPFLEGLRETRDRYLSSPSPTGDVVPGASLPSRLATSGSRTPRTAQRCLMSVSGSSAVRSWGSSVPLARASPPLRSYCSGCRTREAAH